MTEIPVTPTPTKTTAPSSDPFTIGGWAPQMEDALTIVGAFGTAFVATGHAGLSGAPEAALASVLAGLAAAAQAIQRIWPTA